MRDELHIASLVVHAAPSRVPDVSRQICEMPGAVVHATSPTGKLVVTLEGATSEEVMSAVHGIQRSDGVLSAVLVYQYADSMEAMMEEMPHDH